MAEIRIRNQGKITVQDADSSNEVSLQAPSTVGSNTELTLPGTSGSANNLITTNASGVLSMTDITALVTEDVAWQSSVKTGDFTAVSGEGYFVNTTSGAVTATLPSGPSSGDFVAFKDYAETFASNNLTIARNGSNIQGAANDSILETDRASVVLIYVDSTEGWLYTVENNVTIEPPGYVTATGGTITTSGDYKIHTFTSSGTFTVTNAGHASTSNTVDYMVVAGGGGGGANNAGGGGAGGFRESVPSPAAWPASPLANSGGALPVSVQGYPITVGGGGSGGNSSSGGSAAGSNSVFSSITSSGGGLGKDGGPSYKGPGGSGGSGGGGSHSNSASGGAGNTPPVSPPQGNAGGSGCDTPSNSSGGGGGGAGGTGANAAPGASEQGGLGGVGVTSSINASAVNRAGGGSGEDHTSGGGIPYGGGSHPGSDSTNASAGTANTGGGGGGTGGGGGSYNGGAGGSGIVIIRYKYQN